MKIGVNGLIRRLLLFIWVLACLSCGTEPGDESVIGTYTLVAVEGSALPYLDSSDPNCDVFISEGELRLMFRGYSLEFSGPDECGGDGQQGTRGRVYNGPFSQSGNTLVFEAHVPGNGTLQFSGTAGSGEAEVTVPPIPPQTGPNLAMSFQLAQ
jgi:hypothetical protein